MEPPKLNKEQLIRLPDSRKHSLVFDWLTKVTDFLRLSDTKQIREKQDGLIQELEVLLSCNAAPPVRRLASTALADLFSKGNPFGAYQIVNKCNDLCKTKEDSSTPIGQRFFALEVIGKLYLELGRLLGSCFPDTVFSLLKSLKLSESSRVECLNALTNLIIGLEASAAMKHQEIYKNVRPYLANSDSEVRSAAALCVAQLCLKYSALVSTTEVEYLFQISLRQMNDGKSSSKAFSSLLASLSVACLDPTITLSGKLRKPTREELFSYLKLSFLTGSCVQKRELISKNVSSRSVKSGVAEAHVQFIRKMKSDWLEGNLATFLSHVLSLLLDPKVSAATHQESLHATQCIKQIFNHTLDQLLSEKAQLQAIKYLGNFIIQNGSLVDEDVVTGHALVAAMQGLTSLVNILGSSSAPSLTDMSIINGLLGSLNHMLPAARLNSAWCIRQIVLSLPTMLTNILDQLIKRLKDFRSNKNAVEGHCAAIASILSVSNQTTPDGIVSGRCTKILHLTTELLKPVNEHYLGLSRVMGSWLLFSALLSVKALSMSERKEIKDQIVVSIKSCFPQGDVKGAFLKEMSLTADKLSQMIEVRSGALRCIQLLAKDEEKCPIIEHVLRSALEYMGHVNKLLAKYPQLKPPLKFYKMRLYSTLTETQSIIWEYGLPDLFKHVVADLILTDVQQVSHSSLLSTLVSENQADILIDSTDLEFNYIGSLQHSASEIVTSSTEMPQPYPLQIQLIDSAVKLFGYAFPLAAMKHRAQITQHFIDCLRQAKKERALCIQINILAAYAMALKSLGQARGTVGDEAILKCSAELLLSFVSHQSHTVRCVASSGLGRLAQLHPALINSLAQISFEKIKDPKSCNASKSGYCLVLGDLHRYVGTRAKASHIRTTGSILLSLASDNRLGVVQTWATFALSLVVEAVGPNFHSFVEPTLDCVLDQLLGSDQSKQSIKALSKLLQGLITVAGPELEMDKNKELLGIVNAALSVLESTDCVNEAILCIQQLQMFVPEYDSLPRILPKICTYLRTESPALQTVAIGCLRQLSQRNPAKVSLMCETEFEKGVEGKLMELFDVPDGIELNQVKDTLNLLLGARFDEKLMFWMKLVGEVFQASEEKTEEAPDEEDEEDDDEKMTQLDTDKKERPHWRTRVFAAEVLSALVEHCFESGERRHFDLGLARRHRDQSLVSFLSDIIRCYFIAATDSNTLLCKNGLKSLKRVIILFKNAQDPDVEDSNLLEQYQANIGAALRPGFSPDALPEVSELASSVASEWLCSGVASSINDIQRVYRLMVSSLDAIRLPSKAPIYPEQSIEQKNRATIEAWAEIFVTAVEQSQTPQAKNREFPPDGLLNLVDCEIKDLKYLWCDYLYKTPRDSAQNSVILHAIALLNKDGLWKHEERQTMIQVISASSVETLLKPPSAVPLITASQSISALAVVHNELNIPEKIKKITYELICVAHRSILTRSNGSNESTKIGIKALKLVGDGIKNYESSEKVELELFEDGTVLKVLLEVITCAISRPNILSLGFFNQLIQILPLPLRVSSDKEHTTAILAKLYSCVLEKIISIADNPGNVLTTLLSQIKETFTEQNHIELFTKTLLDINDGNILTLLTTLSFISITFCNTLKEKTSSIYHKINSYFESPVYHRHISKLMATAMRVFVTQSDHDQSKALMIVGTKMAKRISENSLAPDAVQDVVSFFESYSTISESKGQIIYFRILFMLLERQIETEQILQKFTLAAGRYPNSARALLAADVSLKLILEKRLSEDAMAKSAQVAHINRAAPKIDLKMNFSNYS